MTIYALIAVPLDSFSQWNDPGFWIDYPKSAAPSWVNSLQPGSNLPNHVILGLTDAKTQNSSLGGIPTNSFLFNLDFDYNTYPTDFIFDYCLRYGEIPPVIEERGQRGRCYPELIVDPKALGQEVRHPGEPQRHGRDQPRRDAHDPVRQPP